MKDDGKKHVQGRKKWIPDDDIIRDVEKYASRFLQEAHICKLVGCSETTWYEKKKIYPALSEAIKNGRAKVAATLSNKLLDEAMKGNTAILIFLAKSVLGLKENDPQLTAAMPIQINIEGKDAKYTIGRQNYSSS